ncbi:MAG: hypothetical protein JO352_35820 [Chloroflexi bacterium]|nr:hypothetical protein [Chloroflexota bacterium]
MVGAGVGAAFGTGVAVGADGVAAAVGLAVAPAATTVNIEVAAGARHRMWALIEQAVGAVAMTEIEVLLSSAVGGSTVS